MKFEIVTVAGATNAQPKITPVIEDVVGRLALYGLAPTVGEFNRACAAPLAGYPPERAGLRMALPASKLQSVSATAAPLVHLGCKDIERIRSSGGAELKTGGTSADQPPQRSLIPPWNVNATIALVKI